MKRVLKSKKILWKLIDLGKSEWFYRPFKPLCLKHRQPNRKTHFSDLYFSRMACCGYFGASENDRWRQMRHSLKSSTRSPVFEIMAGSQAARPRVWRARATLAAPITEGTKWRYVCPSRRVSSARYWARLLASQSSNERKYELGGRSNKIKIKSSQAKEVVPYFVNIAD